MRQPIPPNETPPLSEQLRQFALTQIDLALTLFSAAPRRQDEAIHETRRCLKRVRALLRLVKAELPATIYDRDNLYLRNVGRQLSALRDAAVMKETLGKLKKEFPSRLSRPAWRELQETLTARAQPSAAQKAKRMTAVATKLRIARARIEKWALDFDDIAVLQTGLRKAYRRGQRALEQAQEEPTAETFHEWRKQVNHLRHQLQLLQTLQLGKVKPTLRDCKALAEILGWKNDLAVLVREIECSHSQAQATTPPAFQALIQTRDAALTEQATQFGQRLYQYKPNALLRSLWGQNLRRN
jgi:CHAD domain-containing protein